MPFSSRSICGGLVLAITIITGAAIARVVPVGGPPYLDGGVLDPDRVLLMTGGERLVAFARVPSFKSAREAAEQLIARGEAAARRSEAGEALTYWISVLRLGCALGRGAVAEPPLVVTVAVARAVEHRAIEAMLASARTGRLGARAARRILEALERREREAIPALSVAVANEAGYARAVMARFERSVDAGDFELLGRELNADAGQLDFLAMGSVHAPDRARLVRLLAARTDRMFALLAAALAAGEVPRAVPDVGHIGGDSARLERMWQALSTRMMPDLPAVHARFAGHERDVAQLRALAETLARQP